jgi:hypothetical protein
LDVEGGAFASVGGSAAPSGDANSMRLRRQNFSIEQGTA